MKNNKYILLIGHIWSNSVYSSTDSPNISSMYWPFLPSRLLSFFLSFIWHTSTDTHIHKYIFFSETLGSQLHLMLLYLEILQCVLPKSKGILLYGHSTIIKVRKLKQYYHPMYRLYSDFANCPNDGFCRKGKFWTIHCI